MFPSKKYPSVHLVKSPAPLFKMRSVTIFIPTRHGKTCPIVAFPAFKIPRASTAVQNVMAEWSSRTTWPIVGELSGRIRTLFPCVWLTILLSFASPPHSLLATPSPLGTFPCPSKHNLQLNSHRYANSELKRKARSTETRQSGSHHRPSRRFRSPNHRRRCCMLLLLRSTSAPHDGREKCHEKSP